jgi:hypothetical protein
MASANGYSVEQIAILKTCIGKLTHSGPYLKSLAADLAVTTRMASSWSLGGLSIAEIKRRKAALSAAGS